MTLFLCMLALLSDGPEVRVDLLSPLEGSKQIRGSLGSWDANQLVLTKAGANTTIPLAQVLAVDFPAASPRENVGAIRVFTVDGTRLFGKTLQIEGRQAQVELTTGEKKAFSFHQLLAITWAPLSPAEGAQWVERAVQKRSLDLLTVEKEGKRMELEGTVVGLGATAAEFTLDGETIPVPRERIRSIHFAHAPMSKDARADILDASGNLWVATRVARDGDRLAWTTRIGIAASLPLTEIVRVDFARSRLAYLSDLEPVFVQHVPFFDTPWPYRRDSNLEAGRLRLHGTPYARGLSLHSKTILEYQLGGEFRRFDAVVGIDDAALGAGDAAVRVFADGQLLWEARVRGGEMPRELSVPLAGRDRLRIEVDYGAMLDVGDQVDFADARLIR